MKGLATLAAHHPGLHRGRAKVVDQSAHRGAKQRLQRLHAQAHARQPQLFLRPAVGPQHATVRRHRQDAFHQRADEFGPPVKVQAQRVAVVVAEPLVFNHAGRQRDQRHRVGVVAAVVARHVQHPQHVAPRVENGRGRTGQEVVGMQVMLVGMHQRRQLFDQRRAHRVGAFGRLGPVHARLQGHLGCARQEVVVTDRMDDGASRVTQHHHALGAFDLAKQHFHDRRSVRVQTLVAFTHLAQVGAAQRRVVGLQGARKPQRDTTLV